MVAKMIIFIASQFPFDFITPKGKGCQGSKAIEAFIFSTKIQEVTSNIVITAKNEKQYVRQQLVHQGPRGHFQIKLPRILMILRMNQNFNIMFKL